MRPGAVKVALAMAGIFVTGTVAGGFASVAWVRKNDQRVTATEFVNKQLSRRVNELRLTPAQVEHIKPIMADFAEQLRTTRRKAALEVSDLYAGLNLDIEKQLTPDQIKRFREIQTREREHFEKEMSRRGWPRRDGERPLGPLREPGNKQAPPAGRLPPPEVPAPPASVPAPTAP